MSSLSGFARAAGRVLVGFALATILAASLLAFAGKSPALAVEANEVLADAKLEARARALSAEFRCLVCQNESIDDSAAPLAHDLRALIREQLTAGRSDAEIRDFLVARYGEFVLLRPRLSARTLLLWLGPFLILAVGAAAIARASRRRPAEAPGDPLTPEEQERLASLGVEPDRTGPR